MPQEAEEEHLSPEDLDDAEIAAYAEEFECQELDGRREMVENMNMGTILSRSNNDTKKLEVEELGEAHAAPKICIV